MTFAVTRVVPVLRMFDVAAAKRFYVDWLGCTVDWEQPLADDGPVYLQVSRGELVLHLSSHHGDGTPGSVVLVHTDDVAGLHAELHAKQYPFMNPGLGEGPVPGSRELCVIDPSSNTLRFFERTPKG